MVTLLPTILIAFMCEDFRPITVLSTLFKLYESALFELRLAFDPDIFDRLRWSQFGFRRATKLPKQFMF